MNKLIEEFEQAVRDHAWRGSKMPEEWDAIDLAYKTAMKKLETELTKLEDARKLLKDCSTYFELNKRAVHIRPAVEKWLKNQ